MPPLLVSLKIAPSKLALNQPWEGGNHFKFSFGLADLYPLQSEYIDCVKFKGNLISPKHMHTQIYTMASFWYITVITIDVITNSQNYVNASMHFSVNY